MTRYARPIRPLVPAVACLAWAATATAAPLAVPGTEVIDVLADAGEYAGYALESGDINDDGVEDLLVSAPEGNGRVRAYFGPIDPAGSPYASNQANAEFVGSNGVALGWAMEVVDVDRDGVLDVALSAPSEVAGTPARNGAVYVFLGPINDGVTYVLSDAQIVIEAPEAAQGSFGWSLASGDLDDDGAADLVVGDCATGASNVFVLFETSTGRYRLDSATAHTRFFGRRFLGCAVAVGHFNDDPFADLAMGAPLEPDYANRDFSGATTLFYGRARMKDEYDLLQRNSAHYESMGAAVFHGRLEGENLGWSLDFGDVNNDGLDELIIGSPYAICQGCNFAWRRAGAVFVVAGREDFDADPELLGVHDLMSTDGVQQFVGERGGDQFGWAVAYVGPTYTAPLQLKIGVGAPGASKAYLISPPAAKACTYTYNPETGLLEPVCTNGKPLYWTYAHSDASSYLGTAVEGAKVLDNGFYNVSSFISTAPFQANFGSESHGDAHTYVFQP